MGTHLAQVADGPHIKQDDVFGLDRLLVIMKSFYLTLKEWNAMERLHYPKTLLNILDRLPSRLQHQLNEKCAYLYSLQHGLSRVEKSRKSAYSVRDF